MDAAVDALDPVKRFSFVRFHETVIEVQIAISVERKSVAEHVDFECDAGC